jgi:trimethylamine--corrinoid protein Co-methyltransferase
VARLRSRYLNDRERAFVHEQTVRVLQQVGVGYNTPAALDLLEEAGAAVDRARLSARLPWDLVERCLATCPRQVRLAGRDPSTDVVVGDGSLTFCTDGTATYMYDDVTGERTEGTAEDLRRVMRLFDALPEVDYAWPSVSARDLDPLTAGLEIEAISLACLTKHVQDEVREVAHVAPLIEIFEAVAGGSLWDRPVFSTINCTVAPLQHEPEMTEATMALVQAGVPVLILPMPQMGTTSPMTVLGTCIVNMAELLSAVVLFQLARPGCGLISGVGAACSDMRTGDYICGAPEVGLINAICIEMSRFYGLPVTGSAVTGDAKASNHQAGAEGMLTAMACSLAGADSIIAVGLMDGAETASLAKIVMDCDVVGMIRRLGQDAPVDAAAALVDDIVDAGIGGHFLARRSTRRFLRQGELWQPRVFQRETFERHAGRSLESEAAEQARALLAGHEVTPLSDDVAREIDGVIERYARLVGAPARRVRWRQDDHTDRRA